ncbi:U7 snRNA-associated Sm-like protein LSm11 [Holothuria leucospilota]|uniref:U7 snRNA-associated Sm-like protein LSm11 n=1 Tax=Holothuria leucospilota TaxID=206669 RepID=A0A9Q1C297_HOLLE|nr:U7 snRNA-associated Sm-like protein LSm11 [Holothuria leucospilota]
MAAPWKSGAPSAESDYCEETDVFSANFDPLRAIYDENIRLPFPEAEPFTNISKFVDHLNRQTDTGQCSRLPVDEPKRSDLTAARGRDKNDSVQVQISTEEKRQTRRVKTVLNVMEDADGPLSLLAWSKENSKKVKVCTRTFKGLRGICIGYIEAFDKFLNLALVDVDEIYRKPPLGQTIYHQEILTFSKIMEHFETRKKLGVTKKPEKVEKKKRNRKERKLRLEEKLKAEGVFIENYHPPPVSGDPVTDVDREGNAVTEASSGKVLTNDAERIARLQRLTESMLSSSDETMMESTSDKTAIQMESCVIPGESLVAPEESGVMKGSTDQSSKKKGKDVIKHEDFLWRHVRQLFVRGDSIVLIAVDKNR